MNHKEFFTNIYRENTWGGSGGGSTPANTKEYRKLLEKFLIDHKIKSVVDYGCGDWMFSRLVDWSGVRYLGIDCVESVIAENKRLFERPNIKFVCTTELNWCGELLIVKDVFQHWRIEAIDGFLLKAIPNFKFILITNNSDQGNDNQELGNYGTRGISAHLDPLRKYNAKVLADIITTEKKEVSLITNYGYINY